MEKFLQSTKGRILICVFAAIIGLFSFIYLGDKMSSPDVFKDKMESLDEKKIDVAEMSAITAGTSVAIAAVPGDATTPIANKMADFSGYLMVITVLILCEKYMLTLSGLLAFKILIPIACAAIIIYQLSGYNRWKSAAIKIAVFAIAFFLVIPASIGVSDIVEETYKISSEYSIDQAKEDQAAIEDKVPDAGKGNGFIDKITSGFDSCIDKAENMLNQFIDFVAVMFITNLIIPLAVFFVLLNLIKSFVGIDYSQMAVSGARKMNSILHKKRKAIETTNK